MAMEMIEKQNFSTARSNFKAVFDIVAVSQRPLIVNRYQDEIFMISRQLQKDLLGCYTVQAEVLPETDGSITIAVDTLELAVNAATKEAAEAELLSELKIYAEDYMNRINLFLQAPNRRGHFPYVLRVLMATNDEDLRQMVRWTDAAAV